MRLGCVGCLAVAVVVLIALVLLLGMVFLSTNIFAAPDIRPVPFTRRDGYAAQQRLYEILQRESGGSARRDPVAITEAEANAFLSRHLEQAGLPLSPIIVRFSPGHFIVRGQTPLRHLFKGPPLSLLVPYVSDAHLDQPIWVTVGGRLRLEGATGERYGSVDVDEFALGRQPLSSFLLWVFMGPSGGGLLKWRVPSIVQDIRIGDRQIAIDTR